MITNVIKTLLIEQNALFKSKNLGVPRQILGEISKLLESPYAIVISGLRRSGKSTLLAQIANNFYSDNYYFVNFEDERFLDFKSSDFNRLHELLIELFGEKKIFLLDEIQNIDKWELFARRLIDAGYKLIITGSNASLLSKELGSKLTGRYLPVELMPFSFGEYLSFIDKVPTGKNLTTTERAVLKKSFNEFINKGGIPDALKYPELDIYKTLYEDIIYRDIVARYKIEAIKELRELIFYLISNIARPVSFNKIKQQLMLGSVNTVKSFVEYLESAWLIFSINLYSPSVKKQQIAAKKIYAIDTGMVNNLAFRISPDYGRLLENLVFLELVRRKNEIFYYKTVKQLEVDFYLRKVEVLIQVCSDFTNADVLNREIESLFGAMDELGIREGLILTEDSFDEISRSGKKIVVKPVFTWLLE